MSQARKTATDIALAAWQAAGITPQTISTYKSRWAQWQEWSVARGVDPLGASDAEFRRFESEQEIGSEQENWTELKRQRYSAALHQPYRSVNKPNPARRVYHKQAQMSRDKARLAQRFVGWAKTNNIDPLPAQPEDIIGYLKDLAKSVGNHRLESATLAIGQMHVMAGYAPPSEVPEVRSALKDIEGTPRPPERHGEYYKAQERRRAHWTKWCKAHGFEPECATAANFREYMEQLATKRTRSTLMNYRLAISKMYKDLSITHNDETRAVITTTPKHTSRDQRDNPGRRETDAEIQLILAEEAELMADRNSDLSPARRARVAEARAHAKVDDKTLRGYIRYGWLPFKRWCAQNNTTTSRATPSEVSAFFCELSDDKGSGVAGRASDALMHVFQRLRPDDNPADSADVRRTVKGLKRERPSSHKQREPIGEEELERIIQSAHIPNGSERPHQTELRAAEDIALARTMYDALLRGDDAARVTWDDLADAPDGKGGSVLTIPTSKTDRTGEGADVYLTGATTRAIKHMQKVRQEQGIGDTEDNRIFRLGVSGMAIRIKAACSRAGLEGYYGMHSFRVGGTQDLTLDDVTEPQLMTIGRWKSSASTRRYGRKAKATKNAVAKREQRLNEGNRTGGENTEAYGVTPPYRRARLGG